MLRMQRAISFSAPLALADASKKSDSGITLRRRRIKDTAKTTAEQTAVAAAPIGLISISPNTPPISPHTIVSASAMSFEAKLSMRD